jgi:hypothetical protein
MSASHPEATKLLRRNALHVASYVSGHPRYDAEDCIGRRRDYPRHRVEINAELRTKQRQHEYQTDEFQHDIS